MVIPNEKIAFVCNSMNEAYWEKSSQTKASDVEGQINLFHWCLRHGLTAQAQNQINVIQFMEIKATRLDSLARALDREIAKRLPSQIKKQQLAKSKTFVPLPKLSEKSTALNEFSEFQPLPKMGDNGIDNGKLIVDNQVAQVGFTSEAKEPLGKVSTDPGASSEPGLPKPYQPTKAELEKLTKSLPKTAVAMFKRKIEPLLARSCYTAGCHDNNDTIMPIHRMGLGQVIPRAFSQRNLHSIIRYADANDPMNSRLLKAAIQAHGGSKKSVVSLPSQQYVNLRDWLILVSNNPYGFHPVLPPGFNPMNNGSLPAADSRPVAKSAKKLNVQSEKTKPGSNRPVQSKPVIKPPSNKNSGSSPPSQIPDLSDLSGNKTIEPKSNASKNKADPFDPAEFNKQYLNKKKQQ